MLDYKSSKVLGILEIIGGIQMIILAGILVAYEVYFRIPENITQYIVMVFIGIFITIVGAYIINLGKKQHSISKGPSSKLQETA